MSTDLALATYVKLLRAVRAVTARVEPRLHRRGLTMTQLGVLEAVLHKGPLSQRELGRKLLTSAGNMTDVIDKLEARGMVARNRCPEDRRLVRIVLTEAGQRLIEDLFPRHAGDIANAMAGLDADELAKLGELLRRLGIAASLAETAACDHLPCRSFDVERTGECHDPGGKV